MKRFVAWAPLLLLTAVVPISGAAPAHAATARASVYVIRPPVEQAAINWVEDIDSADLRQACELQVQPEVNGVPCSDLPESIPINCLPPHLVVGGANRKALRPSQLRGAEEQVVQAWYEDSEHAVITLRSQARTARWRGVVGVQLVSDAWKVLYIRQGSNLFAPATNVYKTETWRKLWSSPTC